MVTAKSLGTGSTPLELAKLISKMVNKEWKDGILIEKVSPITKDLLRFWAPDGSFADLRNFNFHEGQWQAILNAIYVHEILKIKDVHDMYMSVYPELLSEMDLLDLKKDKYAHTTLKAKLGCFASSNPKSNPPHPANKETTLSNFFPFFLECIFNLLYKASCNAPVQQVLFCWLCFIRLSHLLFSVIVPSPAFSAGVDCIAEFLCIKLW